MNRTKIRNSGKTPEQKTPERKKRMGKGVRRMSGILTGLLYPARCAVCDEVLSASEKGICASCRACIRTVEDPYCIKCGKPLHDGQITYCHDCGTTVHAFTRGRILFYYEDIRESVYRFKYEGRQEYASFYAAEAERIVGEEIRSWNAEALIPIPLHEAKLKKRGYNQAALFAEALSARMGIPVLEEALARERNTVPQKGLNREERQKNLKKAFKMIRNDVKLKTIILIDDIYTTGSTVDEAGALLRQAGISDIYVITLASGNGI